MWGRFLFWGTMGLCLFLFLLLVGGLIAVSSLDALMTGIAPLLEVSAYD